MLTHSQRFPRIIKNSVIRSHLEIRRFLVDPYFSTGYDNSAGDDNLTTDE